MSGNSSVVKYVFKNATTNVTIHVKSFESGKTDNVSVATIDFYNALGVKISPVYVPFKEGALYTLVQLNQFGKDYGYDLFKYDASSSVTTENTSPVITFHVTAANGGADVAAVDVTFNGETKATSAGGLAVFNNVPIATLPYTVVKATYVTQTSTKTVTITASVNISLVAS